MAARFASIANRTVQSYFTAWRLFTVELRAHLHLALEHRRARITGRAFVAWASAAAELHLTSIENAELAKDHLFGITARKALQALGSAVERGRGRREALLRVLKSAYASERKVGAKGAEVSICLRAQGRSQGCLSHLGVVDA